MELGWGALALLCLAGLAAWFWQDSLAAREAANAAAMEACRRLSLQFLDGTAAFARLSLTRDAGRLTLRRTYVFDYTANSIERRQGFVVLAGPRVESVGYAPGDTPSALPHPPRFSARSEIAEGFTPKTPTGRTVVPPGEIEPGARHPGNERRPAGGEPGARALDLQPVRLEFRAQFSVAPPPRSQAQSGGEPSRLTVGAETARRRDSRNAQARDVPDSTDSEGVADADTADADRGSAAKGSATNVLDLAQWRARNRRPTPDGAPVADGNRKGS